MQNAKTESFLNVFSKKINNNKNYIILLNCLNVIQNCIKTFEKLDALNLKKKTFQNYVFITQWEH